MRLKKYFSLFTSFIVTGCASFLLTACNEEMIRKTAEELLKPGAPASELHEAQSPPQIIHFRSDKPFVMAGGTAKLEWRVDNADTVEISGLGTVASSGSQTVDPQKLPTYTLVAKNNAGQSVTSEVRISVGYPMMKKGEGPPPSQPSDKLKIIEPKKPELMGEPIRELPIQKMPVKIITLAAPKQVFPVNGSTFSNYPRRTKLSWQKVSGASSYTVEIDCFHCCAKNRWCTDVRKTYKVVPSVKETSYTFEFSGAQPGRWRVWAVSADGKGGNKSIWRTFSYTR